MSLATTAWSQQPSPQSSAPPAAAAPTSQTAPEITSHEETTTFKVKVNLVEVRVVVRDSTGKPVGNLTQDDFTLLDNGKPQVISKFVMEKAGVAASAPTKSATGAAENPSQPAAAAAPVIPQRYVAYLFDDVHMKQGDLAQAKDTAKIQLKSMAPTDRAAIFTTSGQTRLDFTDDIEQLVATVFRISLHPLGKGALTPCPNISYYMADLITNKRDLRATITAAQDALHCAYMDDPAMVNKAQALAETTALEELTRNDDETRLAFSVMNDVIRRTAAMPGERTIVLVSPGFLNPDEVRHQSDVTERALKANVIINTMDVRGLYTELPDVSDDRPPAATIAGYVQQYTSQEMAADQDILSTLAYETGGTFFRNNNDLGEGFHRLASPPEYSYILGFSPQGLKLDGRYHKLNVMLRHIAHDTVQSRKGYYAPKGPSDASEQAKQDIEDAVLSREEIRDIPVDLHTQFFKSGQDDAKLSVVAHVDVRHMHFRKDNGRNDNDVTVVSALFDHNGNFVAGTEKVLQLRLKDETLEARLGSGITLKSSFDVKPGSYVVRLVVRGEDGQLATQNGSVEIP